MFRESVLLLLRVMQHFFSHSRCGISESVLLLLLIIILGADAEGVYVVRSNVMFSSLYTQHAR